MTSSWGRHQAGSPRNWGVVGRGRGQLCVQVRLNNGWVGKGRAEVGGSARAVGATVANLKSPGKALEEVVNQCLVRVQCQEVGQ